MDFRHWIKLCSRSLLKNLAQYKSHYRNIRISVLLIRSVVTVSPSLVDLPVGLRGIAPEGIRPISGTHQAGDPRPLMNRDPPSGGSRTFLSSPGADL